MLSLHVFKWACAQDTAIGAMGEELILSWNKKSDIAKCFHWFAMTLVQIRIPSLFLPQFLSTGQHLHPLQHSVPSPFWDISLLAVITLLMNSSPTFCTAVRDLPQKWSARLFYQCASVHRSVQVCRGVCKCAKECASVQSSVQVCKGVEKLLGSGILFHTAPVIQPWHDLDREICTT